MPLDQRRHDAAHCSCVFLTRPRRSFAPPDTEGEDYEGGRSLDEMREFAASLGPGCSAVTKENCDAEQLAELEQLMATPKLELLAELLKLKKQVSDADEAHEELTKSLEAQYEESNNQLEQLKKELSPRIKKLRAATATADGESASKEEL